MIFVSRLRVALVVLLLLGASVAANTQLSAVNASVPEQRIHLPREGWLAPLSFGYRNLWSEVLWIRTISWFGAHTQDAEYDYLGELLQAITRLNPRAEHAYFMAGAVLPWNTGSTRLSRPLLEQAMRAMPDDWRWPYYRGFNAYWFDHDTAAAGQLLARSATLPGAPPLVTRLALRMQVTAGQLDTALLFLQQLLQEKQDSHIRGQLQQLLLTIETERVLVTLDAHLAMLSQRFHDERDLQQLRQAGVGLPAKLPDGGHIVVLQDGGVVSSASGKRFRIFVPPKQKGIPE